MSESTNSGANQEKPAKPFLRILKGNPDATQVATLTALFATMASNAAAAQEQQRDRNLWGNLDERLRRPMSYSPSAFHKAWQVDLFCWSSGFPRPAVAPSTSLGNGFSAVQDYFPRCGGETPPDHPPRRQGGRTVQN